MLFFDYEVFKYDWMVVVMDLLNEEEHVIINDVDKLRALHEKNEDNIWVGYNNNHYDQWIHKAILSDMNPKVVNDYIIEQGNPGYKFAPRMFRNIKMINYDVMELNDGGLKRLEAFMGHNIKESNIPFDIDRKLTDDEIQDTVEYCRYDVRETIEIFLRRTDQFTTQMEVVKMVSDESGLDLELLSRSNAQLTATMLGAQREYRDDEFDIQLPDNLDLGRYQYVADWYLDPANHRYHADNGRRNQLITDVAGVEHVFGWGGVHGAIDKYTGDGDYILMDVRSMYPSLMIQYNLQSRNVRDLDIFRNMYYQRRKWQEEKDPRQELLKLFLNTTYGAMKHVSNPLYDPRQANLVCVYGQLFLLDLIDKVEPYADIIQSNTDGILIRLKESSHFDKIDDIAFEWEKRTRLELEFEEYWRVVQKDVNNYVIVDPYDNYVSTGGWVMKLNDLKNDLPIVNKAIVNKIVNDVPPEITIGECNDLREFQMIARIGRKFSHLQLGNEKLDEKTVRLFASARSDDSQLYKHHIATDKLQRYQNSPLQSFVVNGNVIDVEVTDRLDKQWYIDMANSRLKDFGVEF